MKDESIRIKRIVNAIGKIEMFLQDKSLSDLERDDMLYDAVLMELMIIGEEATRLSEEAKTVYPDVPWHKMVGMRNRITHDYFHVDPKIIWDTFEIDLPELKQQLRK